MSKITKGEFAEGEYHRFASFNFSHPYQSCEKIAGSVT
jgi:hypothetical protein